MSKAALHKPKMIGHVETLTRLLHIYAYISVSVYRQIYTNMFSETKQMPLRNE